jgi:Lon protease-like protein
MEDNIKKLFTIEPNQLPSSIPLFPLDNVLLLPFGKLPLNIFEERYLKMALDSLKTHRMIGVIQPKNNNNELFMMGCIGKITSYIETPDYRIVINLEGVCQIYFRREKSDN